MRAIASSSSPRLYCPPVLSDTLHLIPKRPVDCFICRRSCRRARSGIATRGLCYTRQSPHHANEPPSPSPIVRSASRTTGVRRKPSSASTLDGLDSCCIPLNPSPCHRPRYVSHSALRQIVPCHLVSTPLLPKFSHPTRLPSSSCNLISPMQQSIAILYLAMTKKSTAPMNYTCGEGAGAGASCTSCWGGEAAASPENRPASPTTTRSPPTQRLSTPFTLFINDAPHRPPPRLRITPVPWLFCARQHPHGQSKLFWPSYRSGAGLLISPDRCALSCLCLFLAHGS